MKFLAVLLIAFSLWPFKAWVQGVFQQHVWQLGRGGYAAELQGSAASTYGWQQFGIGVLFIAAAVGSWLWANKIDD